MIVLAHSELCGALIRQDQDREGEEGAREAARHDSDGNQRGRNRWRDGEGKKILPAADVRGRTNRDRQFERKITKKAIFSTFYFENEALLKTTTIFLLFEILQDESDRCSAAIAPDWTLPDPSALILSVYSISSKLTRLKSKKEWICCRTSSSTSMHSASKTSSI